MSSSNYREISNALNNYYGNKMKLYEVGTEFREEYRQKMEEQKKLVSELQAKASAFDEIVEKYEGVMKEVRNRKFKVTSDVTLLGLKVEKVIKKYERGESK